MENETAPANRQGSAALLIVIGIAVLVSAVGLHQGGPSRLVLRSQ